MFDDRSRRYHNQFVPLGRVEADAYKPFIGKEALDDLKRVAEPLMNKSWINVNSTFVGGGVAEMLQSVIPFARGLGIDCRWFVLEGDNEFFSVTKKFHNLLQGVDQPITLEEIFHAYLDNIRAETHEQDILGDFIIVHDPQPAALIMQGNLYGHIVWRCHIDTSKASRRIFRFLLPYINHYEGAIFTDRTFAEPHIQIPIYEVAPSIDPLRSKNRERTKEEALKTLEPVFTEHNIDAERPIILAVSRYDVHKNQKTIIEAFKQLKKDLKPGLHPLLVIVGNSAADDPEGSQMYQEISQKAGSDVDIRLLLNIPNNDEVIGSLLRICTAFVHISTREGFGLVVTEAMWQEAPVIGSKVGGIVKQVVDGKTGFLVDPFDVTSISKHMRSLLEDPELARRLGRDGKERVRSHFLLPSMLKNELKIMRYHLELDRDPPAFRTNEPTYTEIHTALYGRKDWPFSKTDMRRTIKKRARRTD